MGANNKDLMLKKLNEQLKTAKSESVKQAIKAKLRALNSDNTIEK